MEERKKTIFSGTKPTGDLTLGNYLGALKNWVGMQDEYNCLYSIVDMHSITVRQDPAELRRRSMDFLKLFIACGLDPEKNLIYFQSHVPAHAELAWVLNCFTYIGELNRMTQFKEKSVKNEDNINAGLYTYPVLMAADILLYKTDLVPVGEDQRQHLEICRDIAIRFNNLYGDVFTVPEGFIPKVGARIMGLQEPEKKMSKSDNVQNNAADNNTIYLTDTPNVIVNKIKRAVTDSGSEIIKRQDKPGISNLIDIYCVLTGKTVQETESEFENKRYGDFKMAVAETVVESLKPIQYKLMDIEKNKDYLNAVIKNNADRANNIASKTLAKIYKKVGFVSRMRDE